MEGATQVYYRQGGQKAQFPPDYDNRFDKLIGIFKIKEYFPDLDEDLLKFAFYGDGLFQAKICYHETDLLVRLKRKYGLDICDNRILESHGDIVLNMIVGDKVMKYLKLTIGPKQYHGLIRDIASNFDLTAIVFDLGACRYLGINNVNEVVDKHNVCANFMENLLGSLSFFYGVEGIKTIQDWFFSFPVVATIFGENMRKTIANYGLESKVSEVQKNIRNIDNYFLFLNYPRVEGHLLNPEASIFHFVDSTGYMIEEETTTKKTRLTLRDPHKRFGPLVLVTRTGPGYGDEERFGMYNIALEKLIRAGFWVVPITSDAQQLRRRVIRSDNY